MKKIVYLLCLVSVIASCKKDENVSNTDKNTAASRIEIQTNLADNIITPAYQDLNNKLADLVVKKDLFIANANAENLEAFRNSWKTAYFSWQSVEMFNVGKAEEISYYKKMNTYPTSTSFLEASITNGEYDLMSSNYHDAVGFPALDYLLYGVAETEDAIIAKYMDEGYKTYLSAVTDQMKELTQIVLDDWTGAYRSTFINSVENTVNSDNNKLVNDFIYYYEKVLRANKIGIPAGVFSSSPLPNKVEALYNNEISRDLAIAAVVASKNFFNGSSFENGTEGSSYKTQLEALGKADVAVEINEKLDNSKIALEGLENSLKNQVETDNVKMLAAYDMLQKVVKSLKIDMLQAFNISVDYVDADGD